MVRLEFEEQNWVDADNTRYQVEGLSNLRSILEEMINEEPPRRDEACSDTGY